MRRRRTSTRTTRRWSGSSVKLRFLLGIAQRIAEVNGTTGFPQVRETLGTLAAEAGMVDAFVAAMEAKGTQHGRYFMPDRHTLYAALALTQQLYATVINTLRELAGGGMIMLPSSFDDFRQSRDRRADREDAAVAGARARRSGSSSSSSPGMRWAPSSPRATPSTRCSTAGASFVTAAHSYRTYDWPAAARALNDMLESYNLADELDRSA